MEVPPEVDCDGEEWSAFRAAARRHSQCLDAGHGHGHGPWLGKNYGKLWEITGNYGKLWEIIGNYGK